MTKKYGFTSVDEDVKKLESSYIAGVLCLVSQSCPALCDSMDYTYSPWTSPCQNTGMGSLSLLQGILPNQRSNQGLLHCRWILYQLNYQGSPSQIRALTISFQILWCQYIKRPCIGSQISLGSY